MSWNEAKSNIARGYLWFCVVVFIGLGIAFLGWPDKLLPSVEVFVESPTGLADVRADYGGCIFGLGIFMGWCALSTERTRTGLLCVGLTLCGYMSGRLLSLAVDGTPKQIIYNLIVIELVGAIFAFALIPMAPETPTLKSGLERVGEV